MANELEKALAKAKYSALPLPRQKTGPTTIFSFHDGQLFIVRNAQSCLPDPPIKLTEDASVDTIQFERSYKLDFSAVVGFFLKVFSLGNAKSELEIHNISSATIQMGGISHHTIETGALVDFLVNATPSTCVRDLLDKNHLTIIAALQATTFTYTFHNSKGVAVKLSLPEVQSIFKADASIKLEVTNDGKIVVNAPRYVGVITWDGGTIAKEVEKARKFIAGARGFAARSRPAAPLANALAPEKVYQMQRQSLQPLATRKTPKPKSAKPKAMAARRGRG